MTTPKQSDLDLYINDIVDKLRAKYGYADKNRLKNSVRFYFCKYTYAEFKMMGCKDTNELPKYIELTYTELTESMNKNELPKEIQKLL